MKIFHATFIGGIVILLGVLFFTLATTEKRIQSTELSSFDQDNVVHSVANKNVETQLQENVSALSDEVVHLKVELLALRNELKGQRNTKKMLSDRGQPEVQKTLTELHAQVDKQINQQSDALEAGFREQTIDPNWSEKAKNLVQSALLSDKTTDSKDLVGLECRNTMCRLELASDDLNDKGGLNMDEFPMKIGGEFPNIRASHIKESDGSTTTVFYLSKDEFNLPKISH